tara:strand:- start:658 stop:1236 length:579 start_codon:yes stop_codon:yes gene_type:complete
MKKILLLILLISLSNCKNEKSKINTNEKIEIDVENNSVTELQNEYTYAFQKADFQKALNINQKLMEIYPKSLFYLSQRGILLEFIGKKNDAERFYSKARNLLSKNEKYYWKKYDSIGFAFMLIEIGDSLRGRKLIDLIIESKSNNGIPEKDLRNYQSKTRSDILKLLKQNIDTIENKLLKGGEIENIIEDRN